MPVGVAVMLGDDSSTSPNPMRRESSDMGGGGVSRSRAGSSGGRRGSSDLASPGSGGGSSPFAGPHPADFTANLPSQRIPKDKLGGSGRGSPAATLGTASATDSAVQHSPTAGKVGELRAKPDPSQPGATKKKPKKMGLMERAKARAAARKAGVETASVYKPKPIERTSSAEGESTVCYRHVAFYDNRYAGATHGALVF